MTVALSRRKAVEAAVLFDLDGTLTDPRIGITRSIQYALRALGIDPPSAVSLEPLIGPPLIESFQQRFGLCPDEARRAVSLYREYFSSTGLYENRVYPGIPELVAELDHHGVSLVLATSKPQVYARRILAHFELADAFRRVVGSFLDGRRTDKAQVIAAALDALGACPSRRVVMVGDRRHDVLGAHRNGLEVIAVGYGFGGAEELRRAVPTRHAATVSELRLQLLELLL